MHSWQEEEEVITKLLSLKLFMIGCIKILNQYVKSDLQLAQLSIVLQRYEARQEHWPVQLRAL